MSQQATTSPHTHTHTWFLLPVPALGFDKLWEELVLVFHGLQAPLEVPLLFGLSH